MPDDVKRAAVYVSWITMKNALDQLTSGIPSRIDRSVFAGIAWNVQTQLFLGMKFLGLLTGDDEPTAVLEDLVKGNEEERKGKLKKIIEDRYAQLIAIDLKKASRAHFEEKMGELYNVSGDTKEKAVRFFLNAADYVGIPLSPFISPAKGVKGQPRKSSLGRPRTVPGKKMQPAATPPPITEPRSAAGTAKTVALVSGGSLTLSATLDLFALNASDRKFVFELIDKLEEYARVSSEDGNAQL